MPGNIVAASLGFPSDRPQGGGGECGWRHLPGGIARRTMSRFDSGPPSPRGTAQMFKNALCLAFLPDAWGHQYGTFVLSCRRRVNHSGEHRGKFKDGKYRTWNDGDRESVIRAQVTGKITEPAPPQGGLA